MEKDIYSLKEKKADKRNYKKKTQKEISDTEKLRLADEISELKLPQRKEMLNVIKGYTSGDEVEGVQLDLNKLPITIFEKLRSYVSQCLQDNLRDNLLKSNEDNIELSVLL